MKKLILLLLFLIIGFHMIANTFENESYSAIKKDVTVTTNAASFVVIPFTRIVRFPKLAVVTSKKTFFHRIVWDKDLPSGLNKYHLDKEETYVIRGDEVVLKDSPNGIKVDGKYYAYFIDQSGKEAAGFLNKKTLRVLPTPKSSEGWDGVMYVNGDGIRLIIKGNTAEYTVTRGGNYGGERVIFKYEILSRSPTAVHLQGLTDESMCHLLLLRLHNYLYACAESNFCDGSDYTLENLMRRKETR